MRSMSIGATSREEAQAEEKLEEIFAELDAEMATTGFNRVIELLRRAHA